ncbi:MAG: hypothetical protein IPI02_06485 [Sterolibacteriaceae bacterium]|nr:hypothetical protein [Sterolibacteriaceae bacterium]
MTAPPELAPQCASVRAKPPLDWAEEEFGRCRLSERLTQRLMSMARDFWARPMANLPEAWERDQDASGLSFSGQRRRAVRDLVAAALCGRAAHQRVG